MKVTINETEIIIVVPLDSAPQLSTTGKSLLLFSSRGITKTDVLYNGKPVSVGLNVMASLKPKRSGVRLSDLGDEL